MLPTPFTPAANRRRSIRGVAALVGLLLAGMLLVTACGKSVTNTGAPAPSAGAASSPGTACPSSNTKAFAKTKFALHAGLAFGTFHRYIYKPYKQGSFTKGAHGRLVAFAKAGATVLFIKRELRLASEDVMANPTLCRSIGAPLANFGNAVTGAVSRLRNGDASGVDGANSQLTSISSTSASNGNPITERTDESAG